MSHAMPTAILSLAAALSLTVPVHGLSAVQQEPLVVRGARIYPVTAPVIPRGNLVVRDGRIVAVGPDVPIPSGARVIEGEGLTVMPGLVESHSHMGLKQLWIPTTGSNNNELSKPINAEVRAIDGLNTNDAAFPIALAGGVTTMNITTGSRSPNSGQAVVVKLRGGTVDDMYFAHGGMKFAIRATERRPNFPQNTDEVKELLAGELRAARDYLAEWERYEAAGQAGARPVRDLRLEAFGKLLTREWVVGVHAHSPADMRHAIALKEEFDLDLFIHHANGTRELVDELMRTDIAVSFGPILPFLGREHPDLAGPVQLAARGGSVVFHQDHPDAPQYYLRHTAHLFVREGMSEDDALRALTINPAALFHLDDQIGSLEPGKDADFIILNGPPLDLESLTERVFVEGREVYNRQTGRSAYAEIGGR
jgi:imidazolonepropionase-like amidohydrolase